MKFRIGDPLPALLPDEFLEDDDFTALTDSDIDLPITKAKKTKFTNLIDKKPKDRRKGSTTYRVAEVANMKLPPKASFNARSTRERWLKGRPGKLVGTDRKPFKSGFFVKK
jgi:U3 small nucleolar RNA-associated protein 16